MSFTQKTSFEWIYSYINYILMKVYTQIHFNKDYDTNYNYTDLQL